MERRYLAVVLSCIMQGLIILPVHGALVASELEHIIRKTNPSFFFVSSSYFPKIATAVKCVDGSRKPTVIEITTSSLAKPGEIPVVASSHKVEVESQFEQILSLDEVREKGRKRFESKEELKVIPLAKQEISAVLFTSGSTGIPKGAISLILLIICLFVSDNLIIIIMVFDKNEDIYGGLDDAIGRSSECATIY